MTTSSTLSNFRWSRRVGPIILSGALFILSFVVFMGLSLHSADPFSTQLSASASASIGVAGLVVLAWLIQACLQFVLAQPKALRIKNLNAVADSLAEYGDSDDLDWKDNAKVVVGICAAVPVIVGAVINMYANARDASSTSSWDVGPTLKGLWIFLPSMFVIWTLILLVTPKRRPQSWPSGEPPNISKAYDVGTGIYILTWVLAGLAVGGLVAGLFIDHGDVVGSLTLAALLIGSTVVVFIYLLVNFLRFVWNVIRSHWNAGRRKYQANWPTRP